jgi:hypothetical protein
VCQRPCHQPGEQRVPVGRIEHLLQRVGLAPPLRAAGHRQQVQVMVAEHHDGVRPQRAHQAQRGERAGAAVHQVPHEPQLIAVGGKAELLQQRA